jgi:hypothetical protein
MTHWRLAVEMWSACCAEGKAIVTMEASRTIMSCATMTTARMPHRLGSGPVPLITCEDDSVTSLASIVLSSLRPIQVQLEVTQKVPGARLLPCGSRYRVGVSRSLPVPPGCPRCGGVWQR